MTSPSDPLQDRPLSLDEVRIVSDLRIMHGKVDDLFHLVQVLRQRYSETVVHQYSDRELLSQDIERVDAIYLWFVKLREELDRQSSGR